MVNVIVAFALGIVIGGMGAFIYINLFPLPKK